jgi:hypothetical protein
MLCVLPHSDATPSWFYFEILYMSYHEHFKHHISLLLLRGTAGSVRRIKSNRHHQLAAGWVERGKLSQNAATNRLPPVTRPLRPIHGTDSSLTAVSLKKRQLERPPCGECQWLLKRAAWLKTSIAPKSTPGFSR